MGSINIDNTGSGGGVTLSSDGTSLLLGGSAVGGSPDLFAENPSSPTAPSATGSNSVAIGSESESTGTRSISIGTGLASGGGGIALGSSTASGSSSFAAGGGGQNTASGVGAMSIGAYNTSSGTYSVAIGYGCTSNNTNTVAIGRNAIANDGQRAVSLGKSYASGTDSFAAAIATNSGSYGAKGTNSIAMGLNAKAAGQESTAIGGKFATANAFGAIALGHINANGTASIGLGASSANYRGSASSTGSIAIGWGRAAASTPVASAEGAVALQHGRAAQKGKFAFAYDPVGDNSVSQTGILVLRATTSSATAVALTTNRGDSNTASSDNQIILPNNSAYSFSGTIVARQQAADGTACAAWKVEGLIRREGSAGTTVLVNSATTVLDNTPNWGMALSADTTNGALAITVTGAASTDIRWVATIHTSEVTYA